MKKTVEIIALVLASAASLAAITVSAVGQDSLREARYCRGIRIEVTDSARNKFIDSTGIVDRIDRDYGGYVNRPVNAINLDELERCVTEEPFVRKCTAYMSPEGVLDITVTQCTPIVKIIHGDSLWYIDDRGECFRMTNDWCGGIPVITGPAPIDDRIWRKSLSSCFVTLAGDGRLCGDLDTTGCDRRGELTLHLLSRPESFIFGYPDGCREKIQRILTYSDRIAGASGKEYQSVNVKYSGQVVCR